jgi:hypothetical protein
MSARTHRDPGGRGTLVVLGTLAMAALAGVGTAHAQALDPLPRMQLHNSSNRGVAFLPLAQPGASVGAASLVMRPLHTIELDGDPLANTYSGMRPIDVDGNGSFEFVQYNGLRFMQVWDSGGQKLWRVENPVGRTHDMAEGTARDTVAVLDLDGDGKQDVAHCWSVNGQRTLVYRRGLDGAVIRSVPVDGSTNAECHMAAFKVAGAAQPLLLVAHPIWGPGSSTCARNWIGYWARTVAFDVDQRKLWERHTCDAGHHVWPLDEGGDGAAEAFFVGKYLLRPDGSEQCRLDTWPATDHVDSMAIADVDPSLAGLEAVVVGQTGTAMFRATTCQQVWRVATSVIRDPQHVMVAQLDGSAAGPQIVVDERGSVSSPRTFVLNHQGSVLAANTNLVMAMQNANLDGAFGVDEAVGSFGNVIDRFGNLRLARWWYWSLKGTKVVETTSGPYPNNYDRWQAFPLVFDYDRDGKDEIVQWGQSLIVVGKVR